VAISHSASSDVSVKLSFAQPFLSPPAADPEARKRLQPISAAGKLSSDANGGKAEFVWEENGLRAWWKMGQRVLNQ
jgi:hypothetical protein